MNDVSSGKLMCNTAKSFYFCVSILMCGWDILVVLILFFYLCSSCKVSQSAGDWLAISWHQNAFAARAKRYDIMLVVLNENRKKHRVDACWYCSSNVINIVTMNIQFEHLNELMMFTLLHTQIDEICVL